MAELKSLHFSIAPPFVPADIFPDVLSTAYWSSTFADAPIDVPFVHLIDDGMSGGSTPHTFPAWCVRGGVNTEQY